MTTPSTTFRPGRLFGGRLASILTIAALTATSAATGLPAHADKAIAPPAAVFTIKGAGFGHGLGMSQYGAYGAAKSGLGWRQILRFYYPRTTQVHQRAGAAIKVWITADRDNDLRVLPAAGLRLRDGGGHNRLLPTGADYTAWRITRAGKGLALAHRSAAGSWVRTPAGLDSSTWWFSDNAHVVHVWLPGGVRRELRGRVGLVRRGTGGRTVNWLSMDSYLRAVVPAEMPTSWPADAVRAQAVAARSYAARLQASARAGTGYDLCDTSSCQVYRGLAATSRGRRTVFETRRGDAAVTATERTVLAYRHTVAFTQFASSNGGSSAKGGYPYLIAQRDPYDGVTANQGWTRTVSAANVARLWPAAGPVKQLKVTRRDGSGRWGGRVTSISIVGSKRTVVVTGAAFSARFGLRSRLFAVSSTAGSSGSTAVALSGSGRAVVASVAR